MEGVREEVNRGIRPIDEGPIHPDLFARLEHEGNENVMWDNLLRLLQSRLLRQQIR